MKVRFIFVLTLIFLPATFSFKISLAAEELFYKELNLIAGYSNTEHWINKYGMMASSVGAEYYRKLSNDYGDYLTLDLQTRISYDSKKNSHTSWGLEIHNAWLEYKLKPGTKLKFGHFDPAFGLEPVIDTHATLLQTLAEQNIGFNKDWGLALRGSLPEFDYNFALQLGSGMSIRRRDGSFLASARIGSPAGGNLQYGISLLYGEVLQTEGMHTFPRNTLLSNRAVNKKRLGLDGQYLYGPYLFKGEVAYGEDDQQEVLGYLTEIDYTLPKYQNCQLEIQFRSWINDLDRSSTDDSALTLGLSYRLSQSITMRAAFLHDLNVNGGQEENRFVMQFYYFGA